MKKLIFFAFLIFLILISCSINKQESKYYPIWWDQQAEGEISSFGRGIHEDEKTSRFIAQNDAFQKISGQIAFHLNQYVSENCIAPGDEQIQNELDKIFRRFMSYFKNIEKPEISIGESEFVSIKIKRKSNIEYFTQLYVEKKYVHASFVEFLDTADFYINPKLMNVLRECFEM